MVNLIRNELIKIFRKKSTYIVLIILALFIILTSCLYKFMTTFSDSFDYRTDDEYIEMAREDLNNIDVETERPYYIETKTDIDFHDLYKKYEENSWQAYLIKRDFYNYLYDINLYKYGTKADKGNFEENPEDVLNRELEKLNKGDWKLYANEEIAVLEEQIAQVKAEISLQEGTTEKKESEGRLQGLELQLELVKMRLEKNIPYGNDYMNKAIETRSVLGNVNHDFNESNMTYQEKISRQNDIENSEKAKYILENNQDINNTSTLRGVLLNLFDEYSIFLVIFVVMIAGGIVSSELEKGTIKMLLVKPFKRGKILLAKYIVSLIMTLFIFVATILLQLLIGGVVFGFDSLSIPAVVYNFSTNSIETYNIFMYVLIIAINKLPIYLLLGTLAFAISCLFGNTVLAVILPIIGNIGSSIVNTLAEYYSIKPLALFPTLNWDFTEFLFGRLPSYEYTNLGFASGVCIGYWLIMVVVAWIVFKKGEVKNI